MAGQSTRGRGRLPTSPSRQDLVKRILTSPLLWKKLGAIALAAVAMWLLTGSWAPPFPWRSGYAPERDVTARVPFSTRDRRATDQARQKARAEVVPYYVHDSKLLDGFDEALTNPLLVVLGAETPAGVRNEIWQELLHPYRPAALPGDRIAPRPKTPITTEEKQVAFDLIHEALRDDPDLTGLRKAVQGSLKPIRENGLLLIPDHDLYQGSQTNLLIHPPGQEDKAVNLSINAVRLADQSAAWRQRLISDLSSELGLDEELSSRLAAQIFPWMDSHIPVTLTWNQDATARAAEIAMNQVPPVLFRYRRGDRLDGILAGDPLSSDDLEILHAEQSAYLAQLSIWLSVAYSLAALGMYAALAILGAIFFRFQEPRILTHWRPLILVLLCVTGTVATAYLAATDPWRLELVPLMLLAMAMSLAFTVQVALFLSAAAALIVTVSLGAGLFEFVVILASTSTAAMFSGRVATRTRLLRVGGAAAVVAFFTTLGIGTLYGQPLDSLFWEAARFGCAAVGAGVLMTALLPIFERVSDVQTDLSLLELGNASHPLLQQLVRLAPGTYNHSITVAALAEAACDSIGANGLLCRVGAYFHDIGKMRAPLYFIENQNPGENPHDTLPARVSALAIIAHVRDGVDLARQHHLPQPIIDLIEQHHGTTLVEYFYRKAERDRVDSDRDTPIDEGAFRYGGPKPQTREAAVLMLSDAVESASRTLDDPTPGRLEGLIQSLAMKRLQDGQFDACRLTFAELRRVQDSLRKVLIAVHHARVKYPDAPAIRRPAQTSRVGAT